MTEETKEASLKDWMEAQQKYRKWEYPPYPYPCRCNRCSVCGGYKIWPNPYTITWGGTTSVNAERDRKR